MQNNKICKSFSQTTAEATYIRGKKKPTAPSSKLC